MHCQSFVVHVPTRLVVVCPSTTHSLGNLHSAPAHVLSYTILNVLFIQKKTLKRRRCRLHMHLSLAYYLVLYQRTIITIPKHHCTKAAHFCATSLSFILFQNTYAYHRPDCLMCVVTERHAAHGVVHHPFLCTFLI